MALVDKIGKPSDIRVVWSHPIEDPNKLFFKGYEIITKGAKIFFRPINYHPKYGSSLVNSIDPYIIETYDVKITGDDKTLGIMFTGSFDRKTGDFEVHYLHPHLPSDPYHLPSKEIPSIMEYLYQHTPLFEKLKNKNLSIPRKD